MIFNDEVFAVMLALITIGSIATAALYLKSDVPEPFIALGLLNENMKIGDYPKVIVEGENITLGVFVFNYMGYPLYYKVVFKVGDNNTIPTNSTPSPNPVVEYWEGFIEHNENATFPINISLNEVGDKALIFELWIYDPESNDWVYSGRWNHLYVRVVEAPI